MPFNMLSGSGKSMIAYWPVSRVHSDGLGGAHETVRPDQADQPPQGPASEVGRTLGERGEPLVITQNGEAKVVLQDIDSFEKTQETVALLKILALGNRQIESDRSRMPRKAHLDVIEH